MRVLYVKAKGVSGCSWWDTYANMNALQHTSSIVWHPLDKGGETSLFSQGSFGEFQSKRIRLGTLIRLPSV